MNLIEMRTMVRRDLKDEESGSYRWTDAEIDRHIAHALSELSETIPVEASATLDTTAGSRDIDVSDLRPFIHVEAVEYPAGRFPRQYLRFSIWADTLTLLGERVPDGGEAKVFYGQPHVLTASASTLPANLEDLLAIGAEGFACLEWASFSVNRVNIGGTDTVKQFEAVGQARLDFFRKELARQGRRNRVRQSLLFVPEEAVANQSMVVGP
jgi:hypothetical protein